MITKELILELIDNQIESIKERKGYILYKEECKTAIKELEDLKEQVEELE